MLVQVNESGLRIGESHHRAILSDAEVEQLLEDRGPEDAPKRSYAQLAAKYKISKSAVAGYVKGRRRGQRGVLVKKPDGRAAKQYKEKVRLQVRVSLRARAKIARNGGGEWLDNLVLKA